MKWMGQTLNGSNSTLKYATLHKRTSFRLQRAMCKMHKNVWNVRGGKALGFPLLNFIQIDISDVCHFSSYLLFETDFY